MQAISLWRIVMENAIHIPWLCEGIHLSPFIFDIFVVSLKQLWASNRCAGNLQCHDTHMTSLQYFVGLFIQEDTFEDVTFEGTYCRSTLQPLWVCVAYLVKLPVILTGGYLAFQIRHVTLPSLRDTTEIYVVIYAVLMTSLIALPLLLTSGVATTTRFIVAALLLFVVITTTITLLYIPKVRI